MARNPAGPRQRYAADRYPLVIEQSEAMQCVIAVMGAPGYALVCAEIEISFLYDAHLVIEVDRRHRGDSYCVVSVPHAGLSTASVQRQLATLLS
ncbi:hypothetical protein R0381_001502 [Jeongeupia wiesaeckerbachi]|uniref:hypothetical protein n=1 Tax=Jeongeupia wiesaeckerbachi TaxID=3051218 RepID=UPI003D80345B